MRIRTAILTLSHHAHNDYIELLFDIGLLMFIPLGVFFIHLFLSLDKIAIDTFLGLCAVMITAISFNCWQIAPIALLNCMWLGIYFKEVKENG